MTLASPHDDGLTIPEMMTAYRVNHFGPPEVIKRHQIETPRPGRGEVLVKVRAAGVGPWDAWIRSGRSALPQPLPLTLGSDLSGTVAALGPGVGTLKLGQPVYGVTNSQFTNAYADYAIADANMLARRPFTLNDVEAASVPVIAITARQALFAHAGLTAGRTVLIHGGGGNVGAFAMQLARLSLMQVVATAFPDDIKFVKAQGAHRVIDAKNERFEDHVKDVDAVIDLVGGEMQSRSLAVLRKGGTLVSTVSKPDQNAAREFGVTALFFLVNVTTWDLTEIASSIDGGELRVRVGEILPMRDAVMAHRMLAGQMPYKKGKIVLRADT